MAVIRKYGAEQARKEFPTLVDQAAKGKITLITKHGRPYAALVSAEYVDNLKTKADIRSLRGTGKGLWGRSALKYIDKLRQEWE